MVLGEQNKIDGGFVCASHKEAGGVAPGGWISFGSSARKSNGSLAKEFSVVGQSPCINENMHAG
jgi:hypothetical protein